MLGWVGMDAESTRECSQTDGRRDCTGGIPTEQLWSTKLQTPRCQAHHDVIPLQLAAAVGFVNANVRTQLVDHDSRQELQLQFVVHHA